jgi:hypothetical protein
MTAQGQMPRQKAPRVEPGDAMLPPIRAYQPPLRNPAARRQGEGFSLPETDSAAVTAAEPTATPLGVFGLEQGWTPAERDSAAERRGSAVLRELAALQLDLLAGGIEPARLSRLALLAEGEAGADPVLRDIIGAISLRARIELARLNA